MFNFLNPEVASPTPQQIARALRRLGWIGLWLQALLGFIPIFMVVIRVLFGSGRQQSSRIFFSLWLAIACLVVLLFSIYWCYHYTQLAKKLQNPQLRPAKSQVNRDIKLGLLANIIIMILAVLIALLRVGEVTIKMLLLPHGSTVITPNQTATTMTQGAVIAPFDMIAIQAMVNAIAAGLIGTIVALLLLHQLGQHRNTYD